MDFSHDNNGVFRLSEGGRDTRQSRSENIDSRIIVINADGDLLACWVIRGGHGSWTAPKRRQMSVCSDGMGGTST